MPGPSLLERAQLVEDLVRDAGGDLPMPILPAVRQLKADLIAAGLAETRPGDTVHRTALVVLDLDDVLSGLAADAIAGYGPRPSLLLDIQRIRDLLAAL